VVKKQHTTASQLAEIADGYESNFFADGRYKGLLVTAGASAMHGNQYHNNGRFVRNDGGGEDGSVRFRGMRGRGSNRGFPGYVSGSSPRGGFQPAHGNRGGSSSSNSVHNNTHNNAESTTDAHLSELISLHSSNFQRPRGNTHNAPHSFNANSRPLRCWTCGEFGHRSSIHEHNSTRKLLPMHAVVELRNYQEVHVVIPEQTESSSEHEPSHDVLDDNVSVVSDDDLDQDQGSCVDNADDLPIKITNQSNLEQLTCEQRDDPLLKPFWDMAEKHKGHMYIKNGLLYHKDSVGGMPVEQSAVPSGRREKLIRLAHQNTDWWSHESPENS